jgi:hypothetical protein
MHGTVQLLCNLEGNHNDPSDENKRAHSAVLRIAEKYNNTDRERYRQ